MSDPLNLLKRIMQLEYRVLKLEQKVLGILPNETLKEPKFETDVV